MYALGLRHLGPQVMLGTILGMESALALEDFGDVEYNPLPSGRTNICNDIY